MTQPAIIAEELVYRYGQLTAVDHISFTVAEGEILGFLGPNGAGKSTTVKMLSGQLRPKEGRATLLGLDVARHPKQVQAQIGVCFEITNLYEQMTGQENLDLFARLFGVKDFDAARSPARARRAGWPGQGPGGDLLQGDEAAADDRPRWSTGPASSSSTSRPRVSTRPRGRHPQHHPGGAGAGPPCF